jgi:hypothetical protein
MADEAAFRMWPNPNRDGVLYLELSEVEQGVSTVYVEVYDMFGRRVAERAIAVEGAFNTVIELGDLSGGMYTVNTMAGSRTYTERLVIQ